MQLQGNKIFLRTVVPSDAEILFKWENDKDNWDVSGTKKSFTEKEIKDFITNQKDIYLDKQLRLMICISPPLSGERGAGGEVGCIDLFEFDKQKAGVGILIEKKHRNKGFASEALSIIVKYSFEILKLNSLYCNITESNAASLKLFQKDKFVITRKKNGVCFLERPLSQ